MFDFKIKVEGLDWPIQKLRDQFDPWDKIEETKHLFCLFTMHCRLNGVLACRSIFICKTPSYTCKNKKRPYERPKPAKKCIWVPLALLLYSSPISPKANIQPLELGRVSFLFLEANLQTYPCNRRTKLADSLGHADYSSLWDNTISTVDLRRSAVEDEWSQSLQDDEILS